MKIADIREPVMVPRVGICKGYRAHVEPNFWPSAQEEYERGFTEREPERGFTGLRPLAWALIACAAVLGCVVAVLWP